MRNYYSIIDSNMTNKCNLTINIQFSLQGPEQGSWYHRRKSSFPHRTIDWIRNERPVLPETFRWREWGWVCCNVCFPGGRHGNALAGTVGTPRSVLVSSFGGCAHDEHRRAVQSCNWICLCRNHSSTRKIYSPVKVLLNCLWQDKYWPPWG